MEVVYMNAWDPGKIEECISSQHKELDLTCRDTLKGP